MISVTVNGVQDFTFVENLQEFEEKKALLLLEDLNNQVEMDNNDKIDYFKGLIQSISDEKWIELSNAGRKWYEENCSPIGSFKTTIKIIN